jgi:hypothetical protein
MDELDMLKKDWKNKDYSSNQITEKEIYGMLHKRSSSIVKWIFMISIGEFLLYIIASLLLKNNESIVKFNSMDKYHILIILEVISYAILGFFMIKFYLNYKKINANQSIKNLIKNILETRKTVKTYIKIVIIYSTFTAILMPIIQFNYDPEFIKMYHKVVDSGHETLFIIFSLLFTLVFIGIFILFMWLFYKLIYGILLKRLYGNYEELKKLEM